LTTCRISSAGRNKHSLRNILQRTRNMTRSRFNSGNDMNFSKQLAKEFDVLRSTLRSFLQLAISIDEPASQMSILSYPDVSSFADGSHHRPNLDLYANLLPLRVQANERGQCTRQTNKTVVQVDNSKSSGRNSQVTEIRDKLKNGGIPFPGRRISMSARMAGQTHYLSIFLLSTTPSPSFLSTVARR
jgi:hypothetical protein